MKSRFRTRTRRIPTSRWWRRLRHVDPDEAVLLFAGIAACIDAIHSQFLIGGQRRNELALSIVNVKFPPVVRAFEFLPVEFSAVQRHPAVGTGVTQREWMARTIAPDDQRNFKQHGLVQLVAVHAIGRHSPIPEACEHQRVWRLALGGIEFRHDNEIGDWLNFSLVD